MGFYWSKHHFVKKTTSAKLYCSTTVSRFIEQVGSVRNPKTDYHPSTGYYLVQKRTLHFACYQKETDSVYRSVVEF